MEGNSEMYFSKWQSGKVTIFHEALTLRGIVVLVLTKQVDFVFAGVASSFI